MDVSLPVTSTLSEILPEISRLIRLPEMSTPWEFTTAAGAPLDPHVPLKNLRLRDGQVLALRPHEPVAPPVVRDAAEALIANGEDAGRRTGIEAAGSVCGAVALGILVAALSSPLIGAGLASAVALVVALLGRSPVVFVAGVLGAAVATGAWVGGTVNFFSSTDGALGAMTACALGAFLTVGGATVGLVGPRAGAAVGTVTVIAGIGALGAWMPSALGLPAAVVLVALIAIMLSPAVATRGAGLQIPRVPTAGQDLNIADDYQDDVDDRARRARLLTDGISLGVALCSIPALIGCGIVGGAWVFAFGVCVAGSLIIHAARHHALLPRIALSLTAFVAVAAACTAVARMESPHPAIMVIAMFVAVACASSALWAPRVPTLEPTTLVWLERAEAFAIIAVIPLAVYLTGAFDAVRSL
ncbi:type VII secretion integral membrane protein EccD [Corynebacterium aquatimens]